MTRFLLSNLLLLLLAACRSPELPSGEVEDGDWLVATSPLTSRLEVPCAGLVGGGGDYAVQIDDASGFTVLTEAGTGHVWLRDPFGVVSNRCWWVPDAAPDGDLPRDACTSSDNAQDGTCPPDLDVPSGWRFVTPGVVDAGSAVGPVVAVDGVVLLDAGDRVERIDLTIDAKNASEAPSTIRALLPDALSTSDSVRAMALADAAMVAWDADRRDLWVVPRDVAGDTPGAESARVTVPRGEGALAASGGFAAVVTDRGATVVSELDDKDRSRRLDHDVLRGGVRASAVDPLTGDVYALVPDGVVRLSQDSDPGFWPVPDARGLVMGRPGDVPTAYAWGNVDGHGVIWRLSADNVALAAHLDDELLGVGTGELFQELAVVALGSDGVVRTYGFLDQTQVAAWQPGEIGLAFAVFAESPKDPELGDPRIAANDLDAIGGCPDLDGPLTDEQAICCAQAVRARSATLFLDELDERTQPGAPGGPIAMVLGINPAAIHQSAICADSDDAQVRAWGTELPNTLHGRIDDWEARGVGTAALFAHSGFGEDTAWWVGCPDLAAPPDDLTECAFPADEDGFRAFYQAMATAGSLRPFTNLPDPDYTLFGGGAGASSTLPGDFGWPDVVGTTDLPDGDPAEDGMYFGNLSMDPNVPGVLDKELSPADVRARVGGIEIHSPADRWDDPSASSRDTLYWPGQTFALAYAYESRAAGLLLEDYIELGGPTVDWSDPEIEGDESSSLMTAADFAVNEQYIVGRIVARRDTPATWWYMHYGDVARTRADPWLGCADAECETTDLDKFLVEMQRWEAVEWRARP